MNPYLSLGTQVTNGLISVIGAVAAAPTTLPIIITKTGLYIGPFYYPGVTIGPILQNELDSIVPHAVNSYVNPINNNFNGIQMQFANMLGNTPICGVPVESIGDFILDVEDNITKWGQSVEEQAPLLITTAVGKAVYDYFVTAINTPGSAWYTKNYFDANAYANRASLPYWVQAAMIATLSNASKAKSFGLIDPPPVAGVDMITAATAAIGVTCAKVMLKVIPRIQPMGGNFRFPGSCC